MMLYLAVGSPSTFSWRTWPAFHKFNYGINYRKRWYLPVVFVLLYRI